MQHMSDEELMKYIEKYSSWEVELRQAEEDNKKLPWWRKLILWLQK